MAITGRSHSAFAVISSPMDGASTGYFGQQTADAVKQYQARTGLPVTGVADSQTQKKLLG